MRVVSITILFTVVLSTLFLLGASIGGVQQVELWAGISDSNVGEIRPLQMDRITRALATLDYTHHEVHDGDAYLASYTVAALASGSNLDILLVTPNTNTRIHIIYRIRSTLVTTLTLYEGTTTVSDGTTIATGNADRNSSNTAGLLVYHTPSFGAVGTQIFTDTWGLAAGAQVKVGGESESLEEIVLKKNTKYLLRINSGTADNRISVKARWYEHTPKD